jgi:hypothetical protein
MSRPRLISIPFKVKIFFIENNLATKSPNDLPITIDRAKEVNPMVVGNVVMKVDSLKYKVIQSSMAPSHSIPQNAINDRVNR